MKVLKSGANEPGTAHRISFMFMTPTDSSLVFSGCLGATVPFEHASATTRRIDHVYGIWKCCLSPVIFPDTARARVNHVRQDLVTLFRAPQTSGTRFESFHMPAGRPDPGRRRGPAAALTAERPAVLESGSNTSGSSPHGLQDHGLLPRSGDAPVPGNVSETPRKTR